MQTVRTYSDSGRYVFSVDTSGGIQRRHCPLRSCLTTIPSWRSQARTVGNAARHAFGWDSRQFPLREVAQRPCIGSRTPVTRFRPARFLPEIAAYFYVQLSDERASAMSSPWLTGAGLVELGNCQAAMSSVPRTHFSYSSLRSCSHCFGTVSIFLPPLCARTGSVTRICL